MHARAAAGSVLELGGVAYAWCRFCFIILWKFFAFALVLAFRQATRCYLTAAFALVPTAQMKPSSSRPNAVMIFL